MGSSVILPPQGQPDTGPDAGFKTGAIPNLVTFAFDKISPPSPLYVQRDDLLVVKILNSVAGMQYEVSMRMLMPIGPLPGQPDQPAPDPAVLEQMKRGWIQPRREVMTPTSDRLPNDFQFALPECYLLSVAASTFTAAGVSRGQAFISVGISRPGPLQNRYMQLISDSPALSLDLAWPGGPIRASTEGPGFLHSQAVANPAAGADWSLVVPANARWRITSFQAQFAASAAAANRNVQIIVTDGTNQYWVTSVALTIAANAINQIVGTGTSSPAGVVTANQSVVLPPNLFLPPGHQIRSVTQNIQAGDQWSGILFGVEEWINV